MKKITFKLFAAALTLLLSANASALGTTGDMTSGDHVDFYSIDGSEVTGDKVNLSVGAAFYGNDNNFYTDFMYGGFSVTAHDGYMLQSVSVTLLGVQAMAGADASSAGAGQLTLFTNLYSPQEQRDLTNVVSNWSSPLLEPGTSVTGGTVTSNTTLSIGPFKSGQVFLDLFLLADPSIDVSVDNIVLTFNTVPVNPTTPVPEPESYAMLLAGLAMLGVLKRRRHRA